MMRERGRATIYGMAGFYLLYLAYQMFGARSDGGGSNYMLMVVFSILFVVIGAAILFIAFRMMKNSIQRDDSMSGETEEGECKEEAAGETVNEEETARDVAREEGVEKKPDRQQEERGTEQK